MASKDSLLGLGKKKKWNSKYKYNDKEIKSISNYSMFNIYSESISRIQLNSDMEQFCVNFVFSVFVWLPKFGVFDIFCTIVDGVLNGNLKIVLMIL